MAFTRDDVNSMAFSTFMRDCSPFGEYVDGDKRYRFDDLDFMLFKMEDALEPLNSLAMNNFDKDYSHIQAAKDNLLMLFDDYYKIAREHPSYKDSEQLFMTLLDDCLKESISKCDNDSDVKSVITKAYVIEGFKREQFTRCSQEEMADNLYNSLSDFFQDKDSYLDLASIEGLFPEDTFKKLRDKNKDPYSYYEYQMSGALDEDYTTPQSDKSDHFKLEYYLDGLRSIVGNGIRKAFREAGGNQSYAQTINSAIQDTKGIDFLSLDSMPYGSLNPRSYVKNCATAHIIFESVWASMDGEPVQTMRDLARDVCVYVDDNARGVLNRKDVRDIVHRFCSDVSGVNAFDDVAEKAHYYSHLDFVNDGKIKETFGPVRKRLIVPAEEDSDSNDFDFGSSK